MSSRCYENTESSCRLFLWQEPSPGAKHTEHDSVLVLLNHTKPQNDSNPIASIYGIFPYNYPKLKPNVDKHATHGWYGNEAPNQPCWHWFSLCQVGKNGQIIELLGGHCSILSCASKNQPQKTGSFHCSDYKWVCLIKSNLTLAVLEHKIWNNLSTFYPKHMHSSSQF